MMPDEADFKELWERLRSGHDAAAQAVVVAFTQRLIGLARGHLGGPLANKVDPEDVVQSAYKSFFVRQRDGQFEIGDWDGLWSLLTLITVRKCADRAAYYTAEKRSLNREATVSDTSDQGLSHIVLDREPRPDEAAMLHETVTAVFLSIADADERQILELSLQGYTATEISTLLQRAERSVRRLREQARKRIEALMA